MVYNALAPIYDRLMSHVEYDDWVTLITRIVSKYSAKKNPQIIELGGGTGILASHLQHLGFSIFASDKSFAMSSKSSKRAVRTFCADARFLPVKNQFDLALFLYDGINYLLTLEEYKKLFQDVAACLAPEGLFLFDITTETNSKNHFSNYIEYDDWDDASYVRHSHYNPTTYIQHNDFIIFHRSKENPSLFNKYTEKHLQRLFSASAIAAIVPKSLFSIIGIWDGFSLRKATSKSIRIHLLLKKIAP